MESFRSVFWDDLEEDLKDPEFRAHYIAESERIAAIDDAVNAHLARTSEEPTVKTTCPVAREAVAAGVAAREGDHQLLAEFVRKYGYDDGDWVCPVCGPSCDARRDVVGGLDAAATALVVCDRLANPAPSLPLDAALVRELGLNPDDFDL